jgi:glycosyltransferase involved in cell wall biosynthesis
VDPDGVAATGGFGRVVQDAEGLRAAVTGLLADPELRRAMGARAREHVERHHAPEAVLTRLHAVLEDAARRRGRR